MVEYSPKILASEEKATTTTTISAAWFQFRICLLFVCLFSLKYCTGIMWVRKYALESDTDFCLIQVNCIMCKQTHAI